MAVPEPPRCFCETSTTSRLQVGTVSQVQTTPEISETSPVDDQITLKRLPKPWWKQWVKFESISFLWSGNPTNLGRTQNLSSDEFSKHQEDPSDKFIHLSDSLNSCLAMNYLSDKIFTFSPMVDEILWACQSWHPLPLPVEGTGPKEPDDLDVLGS